jgi:tetratricopeptide (TPR) repeat protein
MATEFAQEIGGASGALYRQGMAHLQAGEWRQAIECFEQLKRKHPQRPEVDRLLEEARLKAQLDGASSFRARRWAVRWRPVAAWALAGLAVVIMAWQGTRFVRRQVIPGLEAAREARRQTELLQEGRALLEQGDLDAAEERFVMLEAAVPGHSEAQEALERIAEMRELRDLYEQGVALQEEGDTASALDVFRDILSRSPDYRDVATRVEAMERRQQLEDLFAEAGEAYDSGDTLTALSLYEKVRERNVSYERDVVERRLFELYLQAGRQIVERQRVEALPQAKEYFVEALALRPGSSDAALERRLAGACTEGLQAYGDEEWGRAIGRLRIVFEERPEYLGGEVVDTLYTAYVKLGEEYEKAGNLLLAYEQYQKAMELPVDNELASQQLASLAPRLTPTPTRPPTRTPPPTPRPFTGGDVQEDQNLLANASFEGGWYDTFTGQVPNGWRCLWLDGVEFPGSADIALTPETTVGQKGRTPPEERSILFLDGSQNLKVFKGFAPIYAALVQDVSGLDVGRSYRLVAPVFVDIYSWEGKKVPPSGDAGQVRLGASPVGVTWRDEEAITYSEWWTGANSSDFYLQYSEYTFDFVATEPQMTVYIELAGIFGMPNNGFFVDDLALHPIGSR